MAAALLCAALPILAQSNAKVVELQLDGVISPASSDFIVRGIDSAASQQAQLVVITLDTPGGLDASMRSIVKAILASPVPVPVATFVAPAGARAASAGTFILYASHIAAMAPASNIGAATPVQIGGTSPPKAGSKDDAKDGDPADASGRKARNDAAAYIRSLAQLRGRDKQFAEQAVLDAASMSAQEALEGGVIDLVAADLPDLLQKLDGRQVKLENGRSVSLATASATAEQIQPDWRTRLLLLIANPQVAVILMMIGVYGLFYEVTSPGLAGPGIAGLISLMLAFYAFQLLPVNWAGVGLIFLGLSLMVAEVFLPSFGIAGAGGVVAFVLGGIFLTDGEVPGFELGLPFLIGSALFSVAVLLVIGRLALRSYRSRVVSGAEYMIGQPGIVTHVEDGMAYADVLGERWKVCSSQPLRPGQHVRVRSMEGLTLGVDPAGPEPANPASNNS
ncbi:NfeD family protein [Pusillimonas noertemannii]|uniref:Membrane-bound serine protease (ClpP class) n=1 Tax=Pusillimonas noertemannii TaxID=305977 RepID=A0A2U1CH81_9BURK|nr:nodulation protein NfeD [Pusillimonas noertemannii]PVY60278.1 membrane-bound serine protease (ClpP class) [Pusillimonas noertemannii]TFL07937.1 nodulation protein NfeD [Pusillimonas noertemannii]